MSGSLTYRLTILGCRFNHAEARDLESILRTRGLSPAQDAAPADIEVVHTCSVTATAAAKSRQAIRRAHRRRHDTCSPKVLVTGCFAGTDPDDAAELAGHDEQALAPTAPDTSPLIDRFARQLDAWLDPHSDRSTVRADDASCSTAVQENGTGTRIHPLPVMPPVPGAGRHIRAELRIQDGCDAHCTFCIIPKIRQTLRSKSIPDAVREARMLVDLGHQELVLTGIFIGAYGHETALRRRQQEAGANHLADLLDAVAQVPGLERVRISSMEPGDVSEALLDAMVANRPVVVPHLHLPLQSGSDSVLKRMNRQYRVSQYMEMIDQVNLALTRHEDGFDPLPPAITTDIICGFPGETVGDFHETVRIAREVQYLHMHVFPYSERTGTAAARWSDQSIPVPERRRRVRTLMNVEDDPDDGSSNRYRRLLLGRTVRVMLEHPVSSQPGIMRGRCDEYVPVHVKTSRPRGTLCAVTITGISDDGLTGHASSSPVSLPILHGVH